MQAENYVTWLGHLGSPGGAEANLAATENYTRTTETWASNSIYDQFTMMTTVDEIINANTTKASWQALVANSTQMQHECK